MTSEAPLHAQTRVVLVSMAAALVVLVLGIAAALSHDDSSGGRASTQRPVTTGASTTRPAPTSTTGTLNTLPAVSTTLPPASTSTSLRGVPGTTAPTSPPVRPAVASPEAAANGLIAAYRAGDRTLAARFASTAVVDVLFEQAYVPADDPGFQGCRPDGTDFLCTYLQPNVRYDMSARGSSTGEFRIIAIDVQGT